ncbi:hypothetical protein [Pectobacterium versatile]|uniref:hypothetical protein n=1 Tax=Pectobacterium versatile TaxID=2488639 RepID=UPI0032EF1E59
MQARYAGRTESYVYDPNVWWSPLARITQPSGERNGDIRWFNTDLNGAPLERRLRQLRCRQRTDAGQRRTAPRQTSGISAATLRHLTR